MCGFPFRPFLDERAEGRRGSNDRVYGLPYGYELCELVGSTPEGLKRLCTRSAVAVIAMCIRYGTHSRLLQHEEVVLVQVVCRYLDRGERYLSNTLRGFALAGVSPGSGISSTRALKSSSS